jgi:basic membrane protein A
LRIAKCYCPYNPARRQKCEERILNLKTQPPMQSRPSTRTSGKPTVAAQILALAASAALLAGCGLFSGPTPTPSHGNSTSGTSISTVTAAPSPTPGLVRSVTLVATIGEPADWTPAGLTWRGVKAAATQVGASSSVAVPATNAALPATLDTTAAGQGAVVFTVGPDADAAVRVAAGAHPSAQFFEMDVAVPSDAPGNVHGVVFDEAEAGYLGGYVAAAFSASNKIGIVGDAKTDPRSANYLAGYKNGAAQAKPGILVTAAYAGGSDAPASGRTAAAGLVGAGNDVLMAMYTLSGIGALREACRSSTKVVAVDTDAWHTVPDIGTCLIASVMKEYDSAASAAIVAASSGDAMPRLFMNDLSNGGITVSSFHQDLPAGLQAGLDALIATLRSGPPRPTPAPLAAASSKLSAKPSASK